ncbi:MAG: lysozyme [Frankiaceae bacterium]|nr:lysozyme [Frankiaceae bacterium]
MSSSVVASAAPGDPGDVPISGPDVSNWNHPNGSCINWKLVAAGDPATNTPPRSFAFIKATEGTTYTNPYLNGCGGHLTQGDWVGTRLAGMARAAYHFARPSLPLSDAVNEAKFFVSVIGDQQQANTLAPVLDLEESGGLTPAQLILWTQAWVDTVRNATGRVPIIYTYPNFWQYAMAGSEAFHSYPVWMADYRAPTVGPYLPVQGNWPSWSFWQFTSSARQPGIQGRVDMSNFSGDAAALAGLADGTAPLQWTPVAPTPPVKVAASAGNHSLTVTWLPADNGGALVTSYTVNVSNGTTVTVGGTTTSAVIGGLTNGVPYSVTVTATNAVGTSPISLSTRPATPQIPTSITSWLTTDTLSYGDSTVMNGTVVRLDTGAALPGETVLVWQRPAGTTTWTQVASLITDQSGTATYPFTPLESTDTRMTWAPSVPAFKPQTTLVRTATVSDIAAAFTVTPPQLTVRPGHGAALSAVLSRVDTSAPVGGAVVDVATRAVGTTLWVPAVSLTADANGAVSWQFMPAGNTEVRLHWTPVLHWAARDATVVVSVQPTISAALSTTRARVRQPVRLTGLASTVLVGRRIALQRIISGVATTIAYTRVTAASTYGFVVSATRPGIYSYRVVVPPTPTYVATQTKPVTLRVS